MSSKRVVVIGDVMLDVVVKPMTSVAPTSDTPADVLIGRGGSGANVAVAIANHDHDVTYVGSCGDDAASELFLQSLDDANVQATLQVSSGRTGTVVAVIAPDGQRAMLTDRGVNARLSESFVVNALDDGVDHVHVSGYVFLEPLTRDAGRRALQRARELGASVSVDVCSLAPLRAMTAALFLECVKGATYLFANEEEALALTDTESTDDALQLLATQFSEVIVTRGANGAVAAYGDDRFRANAKSVTAIDTTGAGDAATGAYVGARLNGSSIDESFVNAMSAAALVVRGLGASGKEGENDG